MKHSSKQYMKGILLAPWAVVVVNCLFSAYFYIESLFEDPTPSGTLVFPDPQKPWEFVLLFSAYGLPTAYIVLLVLFLPAYLLIQKLEKGRNWFILLAALICTIPTIVFYGQPRSALSLAIFLAPHGLAVAYTFHLIVDRRKKTLAEQDGGHNSGSSAASIVTP